MAQIHSWDLISHFRRPQAEKATIVQWCTKRNAQRGKKKAF